MLYLYTGNGKGKTTAALGAALRAIGYGWNVCVIQFMKSTWTTGEIAALDSLAKARLKTNVSMSSKHNILYIPNIELHRCGKGFYKILDDKFTDEEHRAAAKEALDLLAEKIASAKFQLIILDEVNVAADLKLLDPADILKLITSISSQADATTNLSVSPLDQSSKPLQFRVPGHTKAQHSPSKVKIRDAPFPHFILTGRNAPQAFLDAADLVTEMREIKHPFQKGIKAVKGLDF